MLRPLIVFGTRPEGIKLAMVVKECQRLSDQIDPVVCITGQHKEMLAQVTDYFGIQADIDLQLMQPNQTLATITSGCVSAVDEVLARTRPDTVVVQGDTTTVMAASLAAFYRHVPVTHVEAGLRTGNLFAPWPEELNRRVTSLVTALHCAPTKSAAENLRREGISADKIHVTGNTVIDALLWTVSRERQAATKWRERYAMLADRPLVLITGHRRENFGEGFENICQAISKLAGRFPDCCFVYPVHLNPNVQQPVHGLLGNHDNIFLVPPVPYPEFVWLMDRSHLILTDSGGVQEEAPSLRKPVLVMRETTERPEAVDEGAVELVGTEVRRIVERVSALLTDKIAYARRQIDENPYGDGKAAGRIVQLMLEHY